MTVRLIPSLRTDRFAALDRAVLAAVQSAGGNGGKVRLGDIKQWFFIFSPRVLSQSITRLVNAQLLRLNSARAELSIAPAVSAIFDRCSGRVFNMQGSEDVWSLLGTNERQLSCSAHQELRKFNAPLTEYVLSGLFKELDLSYYRGYIEFVLEDAEGKHYD